MTFFLISGEASGDMHAAALILSLQQREPSAVFVGMGGDKMEVAGCHLVRHYRDMAFMGVVAVLRNLKKVRENFRIAKKSLLNQRPDVLILIDYPSFNLNIAAFCRKHLPATKIVYYIPPKVWAWKTWRIHKIAKYANEVLCIFPFEPTFFARYGYNATFVGNPTMSALREQNRPTTYDPQPTTIALLPGSREHEIRNCLPRMLAAAARFNGYHVVIAQAPSQPKALYDDIIATTRKQFALEQLEVSLITDTYALLRDARAAVVNSGTATLEAAIIGCPHVAVYHVAFGHLLNLVRPLLFKTKYFTLPNIIADKEVIRELLAYEFTADSVEHELKRLLDDEDYRQQMLSDFASIRDILGTSSAPDRAADLILPSPNGQVAYTTQPH